MRTGFLVVFFCCFSTVFAAQSTAHSAATDIELYSYSLSSTQFDRLFCKYGNMYVSIRGSEDELWIDQFNSDGKLLAQPKVKQPDSLMFCRYHGAKQFQGTIYVFFTGRTKSTAKGHYGVYAWEYSPQSYAFKTCHLLAEFPLVDAVNRMFIEVSENGNYLGIVTEPKTFCKVYKYAVLVLNKDFKLVFKDHKRSQELEACHQFTSLHMSNNGRLTLIYTENFETYHDRGFQEPHSHASFITFLNDTLSKQVQFIHDPLRKILQLTVVETETDPQLFMAWSYEDSADHIGFSLIDPLTLKETRVYEFDPEILEPFVGNSDYGVYVDRIKTKNENGMIKFNPGISIVDLFRYRDQDFFLLEKKTPLKLGSSKSETEGAYLDLEGDILLVNSSTNKVLKLERQVFTPNVPRGVINRISGESLELWYYADTLTERSKSGSVDYLTTFLDPTYKAQDRHLYKTVVNLDSLTYTSEEIIPRDAKKNYIHVSLQRAFATDSSFTTIGWAGKKLYVMHLNQLEKPEVKTN